MFSTLKNKCFKIAAFFAIGFSVISSPVQSQTIENYLNNNQNNYYSYVINASESNQRVKDWKNLVEELRESELSTKNKILLVNSFWNANIVMAEDIDVWGKKDYWATPLETLKKGRGDCEDYALAKYVTLLAIGIPQEKLHLMVTKLRTGGITSPVSHMVLTYIKDDSRNPIVLDNVMSSARRLEKRVDLMSLFSFNNTGVYVNGVYNSDSKNMKAWTSFSNKIEKSQPMLARNKKPSMAKVY